MWQVAEKLNFCATRHALRFKLRLLVARVGESRRRLRFL